MIERSVKAKIRAVLNRYRAHGIYVYMPVPGGYGESTLDYLGFIYGYGFAIEAKRPGGKPTPRQEGIIERIEASGVPVFVVSDDASLAGLDWWLDAVVTNDGDPNVIDIRLARKETLGHSGIHDSSADEIRPRLRAQRIRNRKNPVGNLGGGLPAKGARP
jgi:hypothetical protein